MVGRELLDFAIAVRFRVPAPTSNRSRGRADEACASYAHSRGCNSCRDHNVVADLGVIGRRWRRRRGGFGFAPRLPGDSICDVDQRRDILLAHDGDALRCVIVVPRNGDLHRREVRALRRITFSSSSGSIRCASRLANRGVAATGRALDARISSEFVSHVVYDVRSILVPGATSFRIPARYCKAQIRTCRPVTSNRCSLVCVDQPPAST